MNPSDIPFLSATETVRAIKSKELSPRNAVLAYIERIDRLDSQLSAYITVLQEHALDAAQEVSNKLQKGEDQGPLAGVPIDVKDQ